MNLAHPSHLSIQRPFNHDSTNRHHDLASLVKSISMATASIKHILYPHIMAATYAYFLVTKCFSNSFCTAIGVASTTQTRHISKLSAFQQRSLIVAPHKVNTNLLGGYCQPRWATTVATHRLFYGNGRRRVTICNHSTAAAIEDILEPDTTKIASRWKFIPQDDETIENDAAAVEPRETNDNLIRNILVCGDGDLSFSAEIASELDELGIQLYATVLEDEETHNTGLCCRF